MPRRERGVRSLRAKEERARWKIESTTSSSFLSYSYGYAMVKTVSANSDLEIEGVERHDLETGRRQSV